MICYHHQNQSGPPDKEHFQLGSFFSSKSCSETLGTVNLKTLCPLSDEMYQEYPGICYKVAYNITND
jgi:hypothetical protein